MYTPWQAGPSTKTSHLAGGEDEDMPSSPSYFESDEEPSLSPSTSQATNQLSNSQRSSFYPPARTVSAYAASPPNRSSSMLSHITRLASSFSLPSDGATRQPSRPPRQREQPPAPRRMSNVENAARVRDATRLQPMSSAAQGVPTRYTFLSVDFRAMVLVPVTEGSSGQPLYHIMWRDNYWSPGSLITTVRRGGSGDGQFVGEFGLGVVLLDGDEKLLDEMLKKDFTDYTWKWTHGDVVLRWSIENAGRGRQLPYFKCELFLGSNEDDFLTVATLRPPNYKMSILGSLREPELKVYSAGEGIMDDIVLSGLMMQCIHHERNPHVR